MKKLIALIVSLLIILMTVCLNSCSEFIDALNEALEELNETENEYITENLKTEAEYTESEADGIPFRYSPEPVEYNMPKEIYKDDLEREASDIIDGAIKKAVSYTLTMKDDRHSKVFYKYESDPNGYLSELTLEQQEVYNMLIDAGKSYKDIVISDKDVKADLKEKYLTLILNKPLSFNEPILDSYLMFNRTSYLDMNDVSHMKYIYPVYHDPYGSVMDQITDGTGKQKLKHDIELLDRIVKRIVRFMPNNLSTYDKYYYLAAVISEHVIYTSRPDNSDTAFGALVCGKAVCEGYAKAYMLLCKEANLYCAYRTGIPGDMHIWNMVKLDSGIYNVDVTWCDTTDSYKEQWYEYFMKSDKDFSDHNIITGVKGTGSYEPSPYEK